ncbi:hypothetical protein CA85_37340 [Allorhodopirellula solitaria]|uniref:Uncharacterized protein n=1 Tax=Allorhodopirellula solitaria TaxID=2527987 RepID=A0A5C5XQ47_9BACT|nr:hypothetical protein CA85_37340 [Allorhodopirellula solitaria]
MNTNLAGSQAHYADRTPWLPYPRIYLWDVIINVKQVGVVVSVY